MKLEIQPWLPIHVTRRGSDIANPAGGLVAFENSITGEHLNGSLRFLLRYSDRLRHIPDGRWLLFVTLSIDDASCNQLFVWCQYNRLPAPLPDHRVQVRMGPDVFSDTEA